MNIYGIKNCDTVKKALKLLESKGISYTFVDYREVPIDDDRLNQWLNTVGSETLINTRSTTWRKLSDAEREQNPLALLKQHPTLIKRPVVECNNAVVVGYKELENIV